LSPRGLWPRGRINAELRDKFEELDDNLGIVAPDSRTPIPLSRWLRLSG